MNEKIKLEKLGADVRDALIKSIASKAVAELITKTTSASDGDSGSFKVVVSTDDVDRQGETVLQSGWDLSFYKQNPVVLWAHDYSSMPIGICTSIYLENGKLTAEGKFAPAEANPFAQQVRRLYDLGMVRATSVGFIPLEFDESQRGTITKAELLEFSFVPVPANPHALTTNQVRTLKIDMALLKTKGIDLTIKEAGAGDRCSMDDGTPGLLAHDPKNPDGPLVCVPDPGMMKAIDIEKHLAMFKEAVTAAHKDHHDAHTHEHGMHVAAHKEALDDLHEVIKEGLKDMQKSQKDAYSVIKDAIDQHKAEMEIHHNTHHQKVALENERHSKAIHEHAIRLCDAMKDLGTEYDADAMKSFATKLEEIASSIANLPNALKGVAAPEGVEGPASKDGEPAAKRSSNSPANPEDLQALNAFLGDRELVKSLSISLGKVLRAYNRAES